jgi:hypothetical protein
MFSGFFYKIRQIGISCLEIVFKVRLIVVKIKIDIFVPYTNVYEQPARIRVQLF